MSSDSNSKLDLLNEHTRGEIDHWVARFPPEHKRSAVLQATFDEEPSVWCALGEFFGAGARLNPVRDWWREADQDDPGATGTRPPDQVSDLELPCREDAGRSGRRWRGRRRRR